MQPSQRCYDLVRTSEGCRLTSYQDSKGIWTIGIGHTAGVHSGMTITEAQAELLLEHDMAYAAGFVNQHCGHCTQGQFDALTDFAFNCGPANLLTSSLLRYHLAGKYEAAALEFPKWNHAGGKVLPGLTTRRLAEEALYREA